MWITILGCGLLLVLIYLKLIKPYSHWKEKGIIYLKPWPVFGNMAPFLFRKRSFAHLIQDFYTSHPQQRYVGVYQFFHPTVVIRDPELIKQLAVKDFDAVPEHQTVIPEGIDPLWDKNLFGMKGGKKWHDMRTTLSPSFTSSKMKVMFDLVKVCAKQVTDYFQTQDGPVEVEMKDVGSRIANDIIGTTAFGVTCDSLRNQENEFYLMGKGIFGFEGLRGLVFFANTFSPSLSKLFNIRVVQAKYAKFFGSIIREAIRIREEKGIVRPDMLHLLLEAKKSRLKTDVTDTELAESKLGKPQKAEITDEDIVAQAIVFFFAGFETVSTLMSYLCYELAVNSDIQDRLRDEILNSSKKCNGNISYEELMGMKYLDMVISETLRKWPPIELTDRRCTRNITIEPKLPGENSLRLDVNTNVWFPIYAIHRDPQYYANPDKFDPERFSDENKHNISPFTYFPFGVGPRICIGSRFALLETKVIIFEILSKFEIVPIEKTQIPLALRKGGVNMATERGIWVRLKLREC